MLATGPRYYAEQQRLSALAVRQVRGSSNLLEALRILAVYQSTAALLALESGESALQEQGLATEGQTLVPQAFTVAIGAGSVLEDVDTDRRFDLIVAGLVADAGRSAMGAYTATRDREYGSIRVLTPPSCPRCAILAGRWYRWSDGFERHPGCDCQMIPGTRDAATYDPYGAYERGEIGSFRTLPDGTRRFEQGLTRAQRAAIDAGADINQIVNASRGMQTVNFSGRRLRVTTEGTTARGLAFRALSSRGTTTRNYLGANGSVTRNVARAPRLSPEAIYRISGGSRDEAIRLLRINGYIL